MTGPQLKKLLFRIYINWAITLLILFIPKLIKHSKEHIQESGKCAYEAQQQTEVAEVLDNEAAHHTQREWCEQTALRLEQQTGEVATAWAMTGKTPENYRNPDWCAGQAKQLRQQADKTREDAARSRRRSAQQARWANGLALYDILPYWAIGAILPWIFHFSVAGLLRRFGANTPRSKSTTDYTDDTDKR
jgi:hypothetical protein